MVDPLKNSALELARHIRLGAVSSEELTRFFLARILRHNPALNAFVDLMPRRALRAARAADQMVRHDRSALGPLHGVPVGIKDLVPVAATPTRLGSRAFRHFISPFSGLVAKRIFRANMVVLGKLATSELGAMPVTEPDIHPPTRNPWKVSHSSGGSSGGSGAAVAAGLLPLAHGSDGAGSVRIPAAFCHLYGFKPSRTLLGNLHGKINTLGLSTMGPLSHTVEDAAAMLDVMSGGYRANADDSLLTAAQQQPKALRILYCDASPLGRIAAETKAATLAMADLLDNLGHHVTHVPPPEGTLEEFLPLWQQQMASVPVINDAWLQPTTRYLREAGKTLVFEDVRGRARMLAQRTLAFFGDADILLTPTVPILPPEVGAFSKMEPPEMFAEAAHCGAFTAVFNITGQPAASVPAGISEAGLPFGIQLVGRRRGDRNVLQLSRQLQQERPWLQRRAPAFWPAN